MTFTDQGIINLTIVRDGTEAVVKIPVYEAHEQIVILLESFREEDEKRTDGKKLTLVEAKPRYKAVFDQYGVPELSVGGYKNLAEFVMDYVSGEKKSDYYQSALSPSSTDSGPAD